MINLRPPCEIIVRYVLPTVRSLVSRKLVEEHGFSQVTTAKKLGTTQAAVSQYLYSKRGKKMMEQIESIPSFQSLVNEVVDEMKSDRDSLTNLAPMFCKLCKALGKDTIYEKCKEQSLNSS